MASLSVDTKFRQMKDKLLNATVKIFVGNQRYPCTGTVVAAKSMKTIILTAAHCLNVDEMSIQEVLENTVVMFYNDAGKYKATVCFCIFASEIALLRVDRVTAAEYVLDFAPRGQWNLAELQPVVAFGHPEGTTYRSDRREICSSEYLNTHSTYDENMLLFDHRLDLGLGCSGAAIVNEYRNIVGLQTGIYSKKVRVMGSRPFEELLKAREDELKNAFEARKSTIAADDMAREKKSLDDALENLTVNISDGQFRRSDIIPMNMPLSDMKIAVHIKYINSALRTRVFNNNMTTPLQQLIEQYFLSGASSSSVVVVVQIDRFEICKLLVLF